jgi:hypothetical protein
LIVDEFAPRFTYHVSHDGINHSRSLSDNVIFVRPVSTDHDDGILPLSELVSSLSVVSFVKADHQDGNEPVRLIALSHRDTKFVLVRTHDGITPTVRPVLLPISKFCN